MRLHHVGILVGDIAESSALYARRFGYRCKTAVIHDPGQTAYVQFLELPGDRVYLELVSPDSPSSHLNNTLGKDRGFHHLCYSTADIDCACNGLRDAGMTLVRAPRKAVAFQGRRIAWLMGRDRRLTELVEEGSEGEL
jgi:methylmalonyl-CoA/ethylmalonyl-CoA epimerase